MNILQNNKLKIAVKNIGAELCDISSTQNKTQFMWDANPNIWGSYAPNLFPIIGALKYDAYLFENKNRIAYITGTLLYNQLGLTTQIPAVIKIASQKRIYINKLMWLFYSLFTLSISIFSMNLLNS